MKKIIPLALASLLFVLCVSGVAVNTAFAAKKPEILLSAADIGAEDHVYTVGLRMLDKKLREKSNGRIGLNVFPNAVLGAEREAMEGTMMGSINMTLATADGVVPSWVADTAVLSIPYLLTKREDAHNVLDNFLLAKLQPEYNKHNLYCLGYAELGFRHFTNNKRPVKSAADMDGLLIRVQESAVWFALCNALKAQATPIAINELYTALQQGIVDGQENPLGTIVTAKFNEVQKYLTLDGHTYGAGSLFINLDRWNAFSDEDRALIQACVNEMIPEQRAYVAQKEAEFLKALLEAGMIVEQTPDIDSFVRATAAIGDQDDIKALFKNPGIIREIKEFLQ